MNTPFACFSARGAIAAVFVSIMCSVHAQDTSRAPVSAYIPSNAHVAIWIDDLGSAREAIEANPYTAWLADERTGIGANEATIARALLRLPLHGADPLFFAWERLVPLVGEALQGGVIGVSSVFNITAADLEETFSNSLALFSTKYDLFVEEGIEIVEWDVILAADFEEEEREKIDRFLEKALARVPRDARRRQVNYSGEDIFQLTYYLDEEASLPGEPAPAGELDLANEIPIIIEYGFVDGVFLLAEGRGDPLKRVVQGMKDARSAPLLLSTPEFQRLVSPRLDSPAHFHVYFDLPHHLNQRENFPSRRQLLRLVRGIGVDELGAVYTRVRLEEGQARLLATVSVPSDPEGIVRAVTHAPDNRLQRLGLVSSDALLAGSISVDMLELYDRYMAALAIVSPNALPIVQAATSTVESITQVNVRDDLLAHGSGEALSILRPGEAGAARGPLGGTIYLPLSGSPEVTGAFNRVVRQFNSDDTRLLDLEENEIDGVTAWESPEVPGQPGLAGIHMAASANGLVMATSGMELRDMLRRLSGRGDDSLSNDRDFESVMSGVERGGLRGFVYIKASEVVAESLRRARFAHAMLGGGEPDAELKQALERAVGPAWWTIHSRDELLLLDYRITAPSGTGR